MGGFLMLFDVLVTGTTGWSVWVATPLVMGFLCGYLARVRVYSLLLLSLLIFSGMTVVLVTGSVAGLFCVAILSAISLVPIAVGALLGHGTRFLIEARGFHLRKPLLIFLCLTACALVTLADAATTPHPSPRTVRTELVIQGDAQTCWHALMFYEEVGHAPPWILRVGLARPLRTTGSSRHVGDRKVCLYNRGRITKLITESSPPRLLAFDVVEQQIGYEHDVRLLGGAFQFEEIGPGRTRVTLSTTYMPFLGPRWAWVWGEGYAIHTLHGHVLEGIRRKVEGSDGAQHADSRVARSKE